MKRLSLIALALVAGASPAAAQIAVSANDGKQLRPGEAATTRVADTVSIIDVAKNRVLGTVNAPASMIGPPAAVAVARSGKLALVTAAQKLVGETLELANTVSVIDLSRPAAPKLVQTVEAGPGASGVAINPAGTLAIVASTGDDTLSIFTISGGKLTPAGKIQLPARSRPTDVVFAPDGRTAIAVAQSAGKLMRLNVAGSAVTLAGGDIAVGTQPYGAVYSPDGRFLYNTNLGGRPIAPGEARPGPGGPARIGTISSTDLTTGEVRHVEVGMTPEHVVRSPDGKYLAAIVHNGSGNPPGSPGYNANGSLQVYRLNGGEMIKVAETNSGAWCQGGVFSSDGRAFLLQCALSRDIQVYRFDGSKLVQDTAATLKFPGRPGAIATAETR